MFRYTINKQNFLERNKNIIIKQSEDQESVQHTQLTPERTLTILCIKIFWWNVDAKEMMNWQPSPPHSLLYNSSNPNIRPSLSLFLFCQFNIPQSTFTSNFDAPRVQNLKVVCDEMKSKEYFVFVFGFVWMRVVTSHYSVPLLTF